MQQNRKALKQCGPIGIFAAMMVGCSLGCSSFLSQVMTTPPNRFNPFSRAATTAPAARQVLGIDQQFTVAVGPPEASLSVSIVEPSSQQPPRGTLLVLHGIWGRSLWMLGTAQMLAEEGYRAVLVDLRGHGKSTGEKVTYGIQESLDLSQVIDELEDRNLISGRLGVYGISFGAATSIQLAGRDERIEAVVAVAPFSTMRDVVPDYSRTVLPGIERLIPNETIQNAVNQAGQRADFDPDMADTISAISQTDAPVLIVHGTDDWMVPPYHALRLYEAAKGQSRLVFIPRTGHVKIWFDPTQEVAEETRDWFDEWIADAARASD